MKKVLLVLLATMVAIPLFAQKYDEIVYLKNGSEIHGTVIEQIPGQSLKIQTRDGNIFVYKYSDIEKITKVLPTKDRTANLQIGHRWFVELAETISFDYCSRTEITGIYGYQLKPKLFIGAGTGLHIYPDESCFEVPVFVDIRYDFINRRATPFVDIRGGYTVGTYFGAYFSPTAGARIRLGEWEAINIGLGYTLQMLSGDYAGGLTIRVGFEF